MEINVNIPRIVKDMTQYGIGEISDRYPEMRAKLIYWPILLGEGLGWSILPYIPISDYDSVISDAVGFVRNSLSKTSNQEIRLRFHRAEASGQLALTQRDRKSEGKGPSYQSALKSVLIWCICDALLGGNTEQHLPLWWHSLDNSHPSGGGN